MKLQRLQQSFQLGPLVFSKISSPPHVSLSGHSHTLVLGVAELHTYDCINVKAISIPCACMWRNTKWGSGDTLTYLDKQSRRILTERIRVNSKPSTCMWDVYNCCTPWPCPHLQKEDCCSSTHTEDMRCRSRHPCCTGQSRSRLQAQARIQVQCVCISYDVVRALMMWRKM